VIYYRIFLSKGKVINIISQYVMTEGVAQVVRGFAFTEPPYKNEQDLFLSIGIYSDRVGALIAALEEKYTVTVEIEIDIGTTLGDLVAAVESAMNQKRGVLMKWELFAALLAEILAVEEVGKSDLMVSQLGCDDIDAIDIANQIERVFGVELPNDFQSEILPKRELTAGELFELARNRA